MRGVRSTTQKVEIGFKFVQIEAPGYQPEERSFNLQPDMNYPLQVTLKKLHGGSTHVSKKSTTKGVGEEVPPPPQPLDRNGTIKTEFGTGVGK